MPSVSFLVLFVYCILILAASVAGGLVPLYVRLTHRRMELAVSFVAGVMLGVGLMHLLGHALEDVADPEAPGTIDGVLQWLLAGFLVMFFFERFFSFHHHDAPEDAEPAAHPDCDHEHGHLHELTWSGATFGLTIHSMIAGVALAAAVAHDAHAHESTLAGLSTFLVIVLHKPFDSLTIGTLMAKGGWSAKSRHLVNGLFAFAIPLGAVVFHVGILQNVGANSPALPYALAFSAGTFLCIAMSDILPELQFHQHDRVKLTIMLLLGLTLAWAVSLLESGHHHGKDTQPTSWSRRFSVPPDSWSPRFSVFAAGASRLQRQPRFRRLKPELQQPGVHSSCWSSRFSVSAAGASRLQRQPYFRRLKPELQQPGVHASCWSPRFNVSAAGASWLQRQLRFRRLKPELQLSGSTRKPPSNT